MTTMKAMSMMKAITMMKIARMLGYSGKADDEHDYNEEGWFRWCGC